MELLRRWFVESKGTVNVSTVVYLSHCKHSGIHMPPHELLQAQERT